MEVMCGVVGLARIFWVFGIDSTRGNESNEHMQLVHLETYYGAFFAFISCESFCDPCM